MRNAVISILFVFSPTDGLQMRRQLTDEEQRELVAGLWPRLLPQQHVDSHIDHDQHHAADDDAVRAQRIPLWFGRITGENQQREVKKWNRFDDHDVLDQIGSNIIRRK